MKQALQKVLSLPAKRKRPTLRNLTGVMIYNKAALPHPAKLPLTQLLYLGGTGLAAGAVAFAMPQTALVALCLTAGFGTNFLASKIMDRLDLKKHKASFTTHALRAQALWAFAGAELCAQPALPDEHIANLVALPQKQLDKLPESFQFQLYQARTKLALESFKHHSDTASFNQAYSQIGLLSAPRQNYSHQLADLKKLYEKLHANPKVAAELNQLFTTPISEKLSKNAVWSTGSDAVTGLSTLAVAGAAMTPLIPALPFAALAATSLGSKWLYRSFHHQMVGRLLPQARRGLFDQIQSAEQALALKPSLQATAGTKPPKPTLP